MKKEASSIEGENSKESQKEESAFKKDTDERKKLTVSVVMATYNGEQYLHEQLDSILAQSYPIHELIIQDDCSTDSTPSIIREYAAHYPCIRFFSNEHNLGYQENFRTATLRATADLVALADQDDVWFPRKIETQVATIGKHAACYSQHLRGSNREHTHLVSYKCAPERQMFAAVVGHSLLMQRSFAQDPDNWLGYMCYDIGLSMLAHFRGGLICVDEPLNWHRSHDDSVSTRVHINQFGHTTHQPTWQPYILGWDAYFRLQKKESWNKFYSRLLQESEKSDNRLVEKMSRLLLQHNLFSLLHLCYICMQHRQTVYPSEAKGVKGLIRGFFFPLIHSYQCTFYDP